MRSISRGRLRVGAIVAAVGLLAAGCGSSGGSGGSSGGSSGAKSGPVKILAVIDSTGPTKAYGSQELVGIRAAAAYYNAKGGIDGHKVEVTAVSDNGSPSTAASVVVKQLGSDPSKYAMVYAGSEGTDAAALVPVMKRFPVYAVALDDPEQVCAKVSNCPHEFANLGSGNLAQVQAANYMKKKGYSRVGILEDLTAFNQSETPAITAALGRNGIPYKKVSFPSTAVNVTAQMSQLRSEHVQAIYSEALGPAAGYVLKARQSLNWNVPIVFDVTGSSLDPTTLVPAALVKNSYETVCPCQDPSHSSPGLTQLQKYSTGAVSSIPINLAANGWDAVTLFSHALTKAHSTSADALTKATETLDSSAQNDPLWLVTRVKRFSATNHQNLGEKPSDYLILASGPVKNGQTQPLK